MKIIKIVILLFLLVATQSILAETLTKSSVDSLLSNVQKSVQEKNADLLSSYLTEDVVIIMEMPKNMGGTLKLNKKQYNELLKQSWAMPGKYTYEVKNIEIAISKDGQSATVTDTTIETIEVGSQVITSKSHETVEIIMSNGVPLIASIHGKVEL